MTIKVKLEEFNDQFQDADEEELQFDPSDKLDLTCKFDARFSQGWYREIQFRDDIWLEIHRHQPVDHLYLNQSGTSGSYCITCTFTLSGKGQLILSSNLSETLVPRAAGKYVLSSNGLARPVIIDESAIDPYCHIFIDIRPSILRSFAASPDGELPPNLQHLIKTPGQEAYGRGGDITPMMATVLRKILSCPYQGLIKRAYLESQVIELMALVLDHEVAIQQGEVKQHLLKPAQIERIHYARELLLRDMYNPPSLAELAQQASLNEFTLKVGFRQVFGTTVFGELRSCRLEIAKQLLAEQNISVAAVAQQVGYGSARALARAFRQKFDIGPKAYQKSCR